MKWLLPFVFAACLVSSAPASALASNCDAEPIWGAYIGQKVSGYWRVKKGSYCQINQTLSNRANSITTRPMEIIASPKECKVITNKTGVAITCNKTGSYILIFRWHKKENTVEGYTEETRNIVVYE